MDHSVHTDGAPTVCQGYEDELDTLPAPEEFPTFFEKQGRHSTKVKF